MDLKEGALNIAVASMKSKDEEPNIVFNETADRASSIMSQNAELPVPLNVDGKTNSVVEQHSVGSKQIIIQVDEEKQSQVNSERKKYEEQEKPKGD